MLLKRLSKLMTLLNDTKHQHSDLYLSHDLTDTTAIPTSTASSPPVTDIQEISSDSDLECLQPRKFFNMHSKF
jgi:hypothetical protein